MFARGARSRVCSFLVAVLVLGATVATTATSHASTVDQIEQARAQLRALTDRVDQQQAAVEDARARAALAEQRARDAQAAILPLLEQRARLERRITATQAEVGAAQEQLNAAAVEAFIGTPGTMPGTDTLGALLGAESVEQLQDRLTFTDAVARAQQAVVDHVAGLQQELQAQADAEDALIAAAKDEEARREAAMRDQELAWQQEQTALADLGAARDDVVSLLDRLRARLQPSDVESVAQAFQGSQNVSYGEWATAILRVLGAPTCRSNLVVTIAWQAQEGTQAAWNPLATTHRMDGSTDFNGAGVQNYRSLAQGLQATKETIDNGWDVYGYGAIVRSMRDCAPAMSTARAIADSRWCYGCAGGQYVLGVVPHVQASFETYFDL
jgi:hypothetical protein